MCLWSPPPHHFLFYHLCLECFSQSMSSAPRPAHLGDYPRVSLSKAGPDLISAFLCYGWWLSSRRPCLGLLSGPGGSREPGSLLPSLCLYWHLFLENFPSLLSPPCQSLARPTCPLLLFFIDPARRAFSLTPPSCFPVPFFPTCPRHCPPHPHSQLPGRRKSRPHVHPCALQSVTVLSPHVQEHLKAASHTILCCELARQGEAPFLTWSRTRHRYELNR